MQHISAAVAFAEAVIKLQFASWSLLFEELGMEQFTQLVTLIGHMLYDRFGSLLLPPVVTANYPDIAYV